MFFWLYLRNNFWCLSGNILQINCDVFLRILKKFFWCLSEYVLKILLMYFFLLSLFYKKIVDVFLMIIQKYILKTLCFFGDIFRNNCNNVFLIFISYFKNKSWNLMSFWGYLRNNFWYYTNLTDNSFCLLHYDCSHLMVTKICEFM